ncbi:GNAT family N-acetyltransferase [Ancylobacter lacus]|uniref:GNAT family N-acetyltransferase n=1 Tax=Ancylobacter lacus TaxID=2579970 RepID=UPI001BCAF07C|nr:GNAT family N-acetyltransferase [Ancylobacter lacus]MBS7538151.1 GNAT family N-acetyltransferase [Ancylobacter lacus]
MMPELPSRLASVGLRLRPEVAADAAFLHHLYAAIRWPELDASGWPDATRHAFLADQFRLQSRHYAAFYHDALFLIVERAGEPIGRLYLHRGTRDHRIVDISLVPASRGHGIGGGLLDMVCAEAAGVGRTVSIHVESFNPARNLYTRKGFRQIGENGPYLLMEWRPGSAASPEPGAERSAAAPAPAVPALPS